MSDRRIHRGPRWGQPRPARPDWQIPEIELWRALCRPHFRRPPQIVRITRRRLEDARGRTIFVRKLVG